VLFSRQRPLQSPCFCVCLRVSIVTKTSPKHSPLAISFVTSTKHDRI
jgi:hypothetical protein